MLNRPGLLLAGACLTAFLTLSACAPGPTMSKTVAAKTVTAEAVQSTILDLKAGEVLQFALVRPREGDAAQAIRTRYFQTAIPYAESLGDRYLGTMRIRDTMLGVNKPVAMALYAFPDEAAMETFQASPDWSDYQRMRREGWEELHVFSATLSADTLLKFDPSKDYTLAAAWTRPGTMANYQQYLDGIEADFEQIGARYIAQLGEVDLQSQTDDAENPSQLTIVEWSNGPDLAGLGRTQGYKDNAAAFQSAISRFDLYWFETAQ